MKGAEPSYQCSVFSVPHFNCNGSGFVEPQQFVEQMYPGHINREGRGTCPISAGGDSMWLCCVSKYSGKKQKV